MIPLSRMQSKEGDSESLSVVADNNVFWRTSLLGMASMTQALIYWFPGKVILSVTLVVSHRSESTGMQAVTSHCPPRMLIFRVILGERINARQRRELRRRMEDL